MGGGVKRKCGSLRKLLIRNMQASTARGSRLANRAPGWECPALANMETNMKSVMCRLWREDEAQDIAEYAVMLAVILVIVVGTIRLIGGNANNVFSSVASSIGQ
jgi:Flp pilus assembly pilin Flp